MKKLAYEKVIFFNSWKTMSILLIRPILLLISDSENNAIMIVKQWLFTIMNSTMIVYGQCFGL